MWPIFINDFARFGHQAPITDLNTLSLERCVSVGGQDRSLRLWKIAEESQLVFRANPGASQGGGEGLERCAIIQEDKWVTGSDYGYTALFNKSSYLIRSP
jgi:ribosomal RNA-processing protein 9